MATASRVKLSADVGDWPQYYRKGITKEQAEKASDVLQKNHDRYHIFYNADGLHNHVAHHILAIWALNASTDSIQANYVRNERFQRPMPSANDTMLKELQQPTGFLKNLNTGENYQTFLKFFQDEMERSSWQEVLQKYVFAGDERADAMLVRMFAGFLHPIMYVHRRV